MSDYSVMIKIAGQLDHSFNNALNGAEKGLSGLGKLGKFGGMALKATGAAMTAAAGAVTALGAASVKTGMEFETAMSQVSATMLLDKSTAQGAADFQTLEDAARDMGRQTAFSASEAAQALNYLALAGYDANKAATALPTVLHLAGAGAMELAQASDMVTDSMSALGIEATEDNLNAFADSMAMTASKSNTSVAQLGEAILTVGGTAAGLKGGITELDTSLGILADSGIKASEGGTHLRNMILALQNPRNKNAAILMDQLGLSAYDAEGNMRSLGDVFGDINRSMQGMSAAEVNSTLATLFKQTDLAAARAMLGATTDDVQVLANTTLAAFSATGQYLDDFGLDIGDLAASFDKSASEEQFAAQMMDQYGMSAEQAAILFGGLTDMVSDSGNRFEELSGFIADSAGAAEQMYAIQMDNLQGDVDKLKSAFDDLKISIFKVLDGPLRDLAQQGGSILTGLTSTLEGGGGLSSVAPQIGAILADGINMAAANAPSLVNMATTMVQGFLGGIQSNAPSIGQGLAGVGTAIIQGLITVGPQLMATGGTVLLEFVNGMISNLPQIGASITTALSGLDLGGMFTSLFDTAMNAVPALADFGIQMINSIASGIASGLPQFLSTALPMLVQFTGTLRENAGNLVDAGIGLITQLAQGIADSLPVLLQNIPQIVINIAGIINDNAPKLLMAGLNVIVTLGKGIIQAIPTLIQEFPKIVEAIFAVWQAINWVSLGGSLVTGIKNGIAAAGRAIPQALRNIGQTAINFFKSINWANVGTSVITLLKGGIVNAGKLLPAAFKALAQLGINAFKSIDWPGVGKAVINLLINGIKAAGSLLVSAIKGIITNAFPAIAGQVMNLVTGGSGKGKAKGGFTSGPTLAGEGGRQEAVISFMPTERGANLRYWMEAGRRLGAESELQSLMGSEDHATRRSSVIGETLRGLSGIGTSNKQAGNNEYSPTIVYNPTLNFSGNNVSREEVTQAAKMSQREFEAMANKWVKNGNRVKFAPA